ncbi:flavonol 4'-sulfotransferase-like [Durio zibethinus]|uniref:Sulfotransferase n=1 Tax=Durio zibethinus TaxID=66656 RepID=A0A6P5YMN8_DURZI|nr:flavonol 4'-sulfotransferase-like [Durio zibethinus]
MLKFRKSNSIYIRPFQFQRNSQTKRNIYKRKSLFGPCWDHVIGHCKASLERPEKVMFLKYEDLLKDSVVYVKKLAGFMGYPFSLEEEETGAMERIVNLCRFENLTNLEVNNTGVQHLGQVINNKDFFRKGKVVDWSNYLNPIWQIASKG